MLFIFDEPVWWVTFGPRAGSFYKLPRHLGKTASGLDNVILPPGGQIGGTAPHIPGQEASPSPTAPGTWQLIISRSGLGHSGTVRLAASESSWLRSQALSPLVGEWQDSLRPQPLPVLLRMNRALIDSPPLCRAPAKLFTSVVSVPTLSPSGDYHYPS